MRLYQVEVGVFPRSSSPVDSEALGERQRLVNLPTVEEPTGQLAVLDVDSACAQQGGHFIQRAEHRPQLRALEATVFIALLDPLQVQPVRTRLLPAMWPAIATVLRGLAVNFDRGIVIPASTIRNSGGWYIRMTTAFEHLEHSDSGFSLILGNRLAYSQTAVHNEHGRSHELTALVCLRMASFLLW